MKNLKKKGKKSRLQDFEKFKLNSTSKIKGGIRVITDDLVMA